MGYENLGCHYKSLIATFVVASGYYFFLSVEIIGHKFIKSFHKFL